MVAKYIHELLFIYDCVILPDFGGFVTHRVSADIHPITNKFYPPAKTVAFNEQLILNDGLLIIHISREENLSPEESAEQVKKFVKNIKDSLVTFNIYIFPQLGRFFFNLHGLLEFEPDYSINLSSDSFGLTELYSKPIDRNYSDMSKISTRIRPVSKRTLNEKNSAKERLTLDVDGEKSKKSLSLILILPVILLMLSTFALIYMNRTGKSLAGILPGIINRQEISEMDKQESSNSDIDISAPINNSDDLAIANETLPEPEEYKVEKKSETSVHKPLKKEVVHTSPSTVISPSSSDIKFINEKSGKYYIIAGSFSKRKNALKLSNKIKAQGASAFVIASEDNANFKVAINKYDTIINAINDLDKFKPEFGEQIWVLAY